MKKIYAFYVFSICNMFVGMSSSLITPFFPSFAISKGISLTLLGFILSASPIGAFITAVIIAKVVTRKNRSTFMLVGVLGEPISLLLFSVTSFLDSRDSIIIVSTLGRLLGGIGTSMFLTPFFGYIPILYPDEIEKRISMSEAFSSVGMFAGPLLGTVFYDIGGYMAPFLVFSSFGVMSLPFLYLALKSVGPQAVQSEINRRSQEVDENKKLSQIHESLLNTQMLQGEPKICYSELMKHYPIVVIFIVVCIFNVCMTYFQPILAPYYEEEYDIGPNQVGYVIAILTTTSTISCILAGMVKGRKREMAALFIFLFGVNYFVLGPDTELILLPHKAYIAIISQGVIGMFFGPAYVPSLPVINEFLQMYYPTQKTRAANYSSSLLTTGMSVGQLMGPIVAGILGDAYGFERACSILGAVIILISLLYLPIVFMKVKEPELAGVSIENIKPRAP